MQRWSARGRQARRSCTSPAAGYGRACLAGLRVNRDADIIVFLDADLSDYPEEMPQLIDPILRDEADLVLGARSGRRATLARAGRHARVPTPHQPDLANELPGSRPISRHQTSVAGPALDDGPNVGVDDRDAGQGRGSWSPYPGSTDSPARPGRTIEDLGDDRRHHAGRREHAGDDSRLVVHARPSATRADGTGLDRASGASGEGEWGRRSSRAASCFWSR